MLRSSTLLIALCSVCFWAGIARGQEVPGCGVLENAFGPYDYRDPVARGDALRLVDSHHFNRDVEALIRGQSGSIIGDLDYALRAFPNHHRALNSLGQYALGGGKMLSENIPTGECYFQRAIVFAPDDEVVRALYANFLFKRKHVDEAKEQYETALKLAPASAEINYNAGLFFLAIGDLERAKGLAKIAYDQGYPLPGLKNKIESAEAQGAKKSAAAKR